MNRARIPTTTALRLASFALLAATLTAATGPAEARAHRHRHHHDIDYTRFDDMAGQLPSPDIYIYPDADWGPFFHRVRHYGPVLFIPHPPAVPDPVPSATEARPVVSALD